MIKSLNFFTVVSCIICIIAPYTRGEFLILDDYMIFDESQNGFMHYWETGQHYPENWPEDWANPKHYDWGRWYARYEVFSTPTNLCHSYQLCIWQMPEDGDTATTAELETCSSPYTYVNGPGIYITETDPINTWWKKNNGRNTPGFDRPRDFEHLGIVFRTCEGCYMTPWGTPTPNCWSERDNYFPVDMRITIVAVADGETFSGWDNYIQGPKLEPPTLNPASSSFSRSTTVEISTSDAEAEIRYTTNGTIPGPESLLYEGPIQVTTDTVILARTYRMGHTTSNITSGQYVNVGQYGTDGLIAHWNFDGDLNDNVGHHDGVPRNGEPDFIEGISGNAISLWEQVEAIDLPFININPMELTLSAWVKPSGKDSKIARILSKGGMPASAFPTQDLFLGSYAAFGSQVVFGLKVDNLTNTIIASARLKNDVWSHLVGVFDGSSMKLFKDGELLKKSDVSGQITFSNDRLFVIGSQSDPSMEEDLQWGGGIDDIRIYGRALSDEEIHKLYRLENPSCSFPLGSPWVGADRNHDGTAIAGSLGKVADMAYPELVYLQGFGEAVTVLRDGARLSADGGFFAWRHQTGDLIWAAEDTGGWIYSYASGWLEVAPGIPRDSLWLNAERDDNHFANAGSLGEVDDSGFPGFVYISALREPVAIHADGAARDLASGGFFAWRYISGDWIWTAEDFDGWIYSYRDGWFKVLAKM